MSVSLLSHRLLSSTRPYHLLQLPHGRLHPARQLSTVEAARTARFLGTSTEQSGHGISYLQVRPCLLAQRTEYTQQQHRRFSQHIQHTPEPQNTHPTASAMTQSQLEALKRYTACDISDALLKLDPAPTETTSGVGGEGQRKVKRVLAGFVDGVAPLTKSTATTGPTIAPAFTVLFVPKESSQYPSHSPLPPSNIPKGTQWSDSIDPSTIVVVSQPPGQRNAAVGGIHALRMEVKGAKGLLVHGRVRDVREIEGLEMPVWSTSTSTVGAGAESKPHALQVPIVINDLFIRPSDIIFLDPIEGAVCIPAQLVEVVLEYLEKHAGPEDEIKEMVRGGASVEEAFARWR